MASYRKHKKATWMNVRKMIKDIKSYGHKFNYKYGYGYFVFSFDSGEYNLHITFDKLPDIKFGIWRTNGYGNKKYHFFAEHVCWIDKFKPSAVNFNWDTLDEMMVFVDNCIKSEDYYYTQMMCAYSCDTKENFDKEVTEEKYLREHYVLDPKEYRDAINKFNALINSIDTKKMDIIWRKSEAYRTIYDIFCYYEDTLTDEEVNDFENQLEDCCCFVWGTRILLPSYWTHRNKYYMKVHSENKELYTNRVKHNRYFRKLKR